jgi:sugar O-acyltransferase (sialic acid O-acetyltransferase NeuD family)
MRTTILPEDKLCIIGAGGFGRETLCLYIDIAKDWGIDYTRQVIFAEETAFWHERDVMGIPVLRLNTVNWDDHCCVIAIADPAERSRIAALLPEDTRFGTLLHPTVVCSDWVTVGEGSIVCAGVKLTCGISLGKHTQLNLNTTVGHDVVSGDCFTTAPGAAISGNCTFGYQVYIGSNASIREKITIAQNVTIGMGGVVVKDIPEPGVYAGNPVKRLS